MYCRNCGKEVNAIASVCVSCGVSVGKGNSYCADCGAQLEPHATVCGNCNKTLKPVDMTKQGGVDSFGGAICSCWTKYVTFEGRANRSEYWYWVLFTSIIGWIPFIGYIASLVFMLPSLAVAVRRLHDIGKSGWWYLFVLIPIVGWILLIVWFCTASQEGENKYGPNPNTLS